MINNKRGQIMNIIWIVAFIFLLMLGGLLLAFGGMTFGWISNNILPTITDVGVVGNVNVTQVSQITLRPVASVINSFTWMSGLIYALALFGLLGFAFSFRMTGNKWLMGFFFVCMLMLVIASIFISNIYEEFYNDGSEVGTALQDYTLLSWFILYSPLVVCIIGFISGIIMFTSEEAYV